MPRPDAPDARGVGLRALVPLAIALSWTLVAMPADGRNPASGDTADRWVTHAVEAPGVTHHTFESAAAKARVSYHLYAPGSYEREPGRRFPVVYWLHGSGGGLPGIPRIARHFDAAIESGQAPPMLVVFVNGLVEGMYVDWRDGSTPLETVIVQDLVPHVDATHRTIATSSGRMLDGFSMGGYGAARLGFKFPGVFCATRREPDEGGPRRFCAGCTVKTMRIFSTSARGPWFSATPHGSRPPRG